MKPHLEKLVGYLHGIINKVLPFVGLPVFFVGMGLFVVMLIGHYWQNWLIVLALMLEMLGAIGHFVKIYKR